MKKKEKDEHIPIGKLAELYFSGRMPVDLFEPEDLEKIALVLESRERAISLRCKTPPAPEYD